MRAHDTRWENEAMTHGDVSIPFDAYPYVHTDGCACHLGDDSWDMVGARADRFTAACEVLAGNAYRVAGWAPVRL